MLWQLNFAKRSSSRASSRRQSAACGGVVTSLSRPSRQLIERRVMGNSGPRKAGAQHALAVCRASSRFHWVPRESETVNARSVPVASMTASASSANSL